VKRKAHILIEI